MTMLERLRQTCNSVKIGNSAPPKSWQAKAIDAKLAHIQEIKRDSHFSKEDLDWIIRIRKEVSMLKREEKRAAKIAAQLEANPHLFN